MLARFHQRLTYANVMSTAAVFIALGGSSYAALQIDSADIANNTVRGVDVRNRSLSERDVKRNALGGRSIRESRLGRVPHAREADLLTGMSAADLLLKCPSGTFPIADVCVVPSIYEPFGLVALEAMASSCPCIVADTGGLREVVPHDEVGLRFRARDPESLAEMTIRVLEDAQLCRRLTAEAFNHLRRFDWADVAERTAGIYEELVQLRSAPAAGG